MKSPDSKLRILHLEDKPDESLLVRDKLAGDGLTVDLTLVSEPLEFGQKLEAGGWDLILADYRLPRWTGLDALKVVRQKNIYVPFILVSGTIGEAAAIESLKAGATDYVLKFNLERLPSAVRRAVAESAQRSQRELAESELRQSEKQYRLLFHGNPHPMWVFDLEKLDILEVNESAVQHYGYSRDEFLRMSLSDLRVNDRHREVPPVLADEETQGVIWRHRRKDGTSMDMEVIWRPLAFQGRLAALAMGTDVTARRKAAHHNSVFSKLSHQLSSVAGPEAAAMSICEAADQLFHWDDFALDLYLPEADEVTPLLNITTVEGKRVQIPPMPQPKSSNALIRRAIERGAELVPADEDGAKPGTTLIAPIRKGTIVIGILFIQSRNTGAYTAKDLHVLQTLADQCGGALERIRAEEELRHSQKRFRELFENSPDAIFVEDLEGKILDVNNSACRLHGLSREQLVGKNSIQELVPPSRRDVARSEFERLANGQVSWLESESQRADGKIVPVEIRAVRVDFEGSPALLFHVRDITERRAAEMALRSSETLFRSVWENSVDGMRLTDQDGIIVAVNEAFCRLVGLSHKQLEGRPLSVVYAASVDWDQIIREYRAIFSSRVLQGKRTTQRVLHDGRSVNFEVTDSFVESGGQPRLLLSMFRDITAQKKLEEQLRQSQKMEAVGQLAGGIAHDFNNILTVILGHASLLGMQNLDDRAAASALQIKQASERAAGLTRQLLAFGRKQMANPRPVDANKLVSGMSDMLARLLGEDIALKVHFSHESPTIEADPGMMEQIILNLAVNARDAMPKGGNLTIHVDVRDVDANYAGQNVDAHPGRYVCISHADTGCGIPPENIARIYEPFFTTKELGKGTGLGLATVFGIVKQHHGWIEVESQLEVGTTFRIFIPAANTAPKNAESGDTQIRRRGGSETILVVEDERDLRDLVCRILRNEGYRVFEAVDGNGALAIWNEYRKQINLLFTDVIMPGGMNGRDLAEKIWADEPSLKVIFSSGYGAETLGKDFKLNPKFNYLQKPYQPDRLSKVIRECLDRKQA